MALQLGVALAHLFLEDVHLGVAKVGLDGRHDDGAGDVGAADGGVLWGLFWFGVGGGWGEAGVNLGVSRVGVEGGKRCETWETLEQSLLLIRCRVGLKTRPVSPHPHRNNRRTCGVPSSSTLPRARTSFTSAPASLGWRMTSSAVTCKRGGDRSVFGVW